MALPEPFWHYSIDHLIAANVLPKPRIVSGEFAWRDLREGFFEGFQRTIPALAIAGNNVIVEHIIETEEWMERVLRWCDGIDVFFVGLHCPLDILEERERLRGDRRIGDAKSDFETTHKLCTYDLELHSPDPLNSNVQRLIEAWKCRRHPSAFETALRNLA